MKYVQEIIEKIDPILDDLLDEYDVEDLKRDFLKALVEEIIIAAEDVVADEDEIC